MKNIDKFRDLAASMPSSVFVITSTNDDSQAIGATLSAVMPLSLDPLMLLASFDKTSSTLQALRQIGKPVVFNLLAADQIAEAKVFSSKEKDKFSSIDWVAAVCGTRFLPASVGVFRAHVDAILPGGDHELLICKVHDVQHWPERAPMTYWRRGFYSAEDLRRAA